jgi:hypothetical protein
MTPIEAIIARDANDGGPLFNDFEAGVVIRRLNAAGYLIVPREPTTEMLEAAKGTQGVVNGKTDGVAILNGLIALGVMHVGRSEQGLTEAYQAMIKKFNS